MLLYLKSGSMNNKKVIPGQMEIQEYTGRGVTE